MVKNEDTYKFEVLRILQDTLTEKNYKIQENWNYERAIY